MKLAVKACILSAACHLMYAAYSMVNGYLQTKNYDPDMDRAWHEAASAPALVSFGPAPSPWILPVTFIAGALLFGAVLSWKKSAR
ncbi:hypothetical protein [Bacillus infantis]|uniref:hypothetical protein n=1 Tax=Bacillus infantis TaxID=324767 RepID=UPI003CF70C71